MATRDLLLCFDERLSPECTDIVLCYLLALIAGGRIPPVGLGLVPVANLPRSRSFCPTADFVDETLS